MANSNPAQIRGGEQRLLAELADAICGGRACLVRAYEVACGRLEERAAVCEVVEVDGAVGIRPFAILVTDGVAEKLLGPHFEPLQAREELP